MRKRADGRDRAGKGRASRGPSAAEDASGLSAPAARTRRELPSAWLFGLGELLLLLPVPLVALAYGWPGAIDRSAELGWVLGLMLLGALAGAWIGLRWRRVWQHGLASLLLGPALGLSAGQLAGGDAYSLAVTAGIGILAAYAGMSAYGRAGSGRIYVSGLVVYGLAGMVFPFQPPLAKLLPILSAAGAASLVLVLFMLNGSHIRGVTLSGGRPVVIPAALRRHNRIFVAAVLLAMGAASSLSGFVWQGVRTLLGWLLSGGEEAPPVPEPEPPPQKQPPPWMGEPPPEPGVWTHILNALFYALAVGLMLAIVAALLVWLYRRGPGLIRRWLDGLLALLRGRTEQQEKTGYIDEESGLWSWSDLRLWPGRRRGGRKESRWEELSAGEERVRYLYRSWLLGNTGRGYSFHPPLTPRETAADIERWLREAGARKGAVPTAEAAEAARELVELYEAARYGGKQPDEARLEELRRRLR
ncbi:protein of unknown function [Paenibacillus sp. UNCCL117]|uniref:DUF4129 domain-containing protein n=1 Tax=unclassified Paenibacillus TaxID=185978 RepID=UPI0008905B92|nr:MULTISPECIES: DUF4129 domain-containing protein [unclassified Paenibacillus]SDD13624.1 protein of unknown function [Paenibacillus sp. cl123]SFW34028.1 protein of unknown function [Paenibacillus sp. UNCCL117]